MADVRWKGGAAAVAQVQTFTMAGTWEVGDLIRVTIGSKIWDYAVTSTTIATFLPLFVTAYNALASTDYPEFAELTASSASPVLTFTADNEGVPFTVTLTPLESNGSAADAQTIEGAGTATTGTAATASAGPNDWSTAANWSGGAVPVNSDNVYLENSEDNIKYGFAQSAVTVTLLEIRASFTGTLGLPDINEDGTAYPEYRSTALAIGATTLNIGAGVGSGSGRIRINNSSVQTAVTVRATGSALDADRGAVMWKGTHASNTLSVYSGTVDVAGIAGETATIATLVLDGDAEVICGAGTTLTTITQKDGNLTIRSAVTTITKHGGALRAIGSGAITTLTHNSGTFDNRTSGTITTYVGGGTSVLDNTTDIRAKTVTNCTVLAGASILDPAGVIVFTNGIIVSRCRVQDITLDVGFNRTLSVA